MNSKLRLPFWEGIEWKWREECSGGDVVQLVRVSISNVHVNYLQGHLSKIQGPEEVRTRPKTSRLPPRPLANCTHHNIPSTHHHHPSSSLSISTLSIDDLQVLSYIQRRCHESDTSPIQTALEQSICPVPRGELRLIQLTTYILFLSPILLMHQADTQPLDRTGRSTPRASTTMRK